MDMEQNKHLERKAEYFVRGLVKGIAIFVFLAVIMLVIGYVVMQLWNWLMPEIFGLGTLTYWQAFGLLILAKIIFGFDTGNSRKGGSRKRKKSRSCRSGGESLDQWKHYDNFWQEEGEAAFKNYISRKENEKDLPTADDDSKTDR